MAPTQLAAQPSPAQPSPAHSVAQPSSSPSPHYIMNTETRHYDYDLQGFRTRVDDHSIIIPLSRNSGLALKLCEVFAGAYGGWKRAWDTLAISPGRLAFGSAPLPDIHAMGRMRTTTSYQELQTCRSGLSLLPRTRRLLPMPDLVLLLRGVRALSPPVSRHCTACQQFLPSSCPSHLKLRDDRRQLLSTKTLVSKRPGPQCAVRQNKSGTPGPALLPIVTCLSGSKTWSETAAWSPCDTNGSRAP